MRTAILQCADTGPLESLVLMLRSAGWHCALPTRHLRDELRRIGCNCVLEIDDLVKNMGYERPFPEAPLPLAGTEVMKDTILVHLKAHRDHHLIQRRWPGLKVLWYRINGGKPEHVVKPSGEDCGDEVNPPCPVLTPNQWYSPNGGEGWSSQAKAYCCWPPFYRFEEYTLKDREVSTHGWSRFRAPICLVHNLPGWGHGDLVKPFHEQLGVRMHGLGSPDGLIRHKEVRFQLTQSLAYVHLKSSDAPGYALYEAMASGCPVVCSRRLIWRCRMQELLIPGETCLTFDRETHDALSQQDVLDCTQEVGEHLQLLKNQEINRQFGEAGRKRLQEVMWSDKNPENVASFKAFMERHFS